MIEEAKGTCDWISTHPEYIHWKNSANRFLWIRGKPGSGKSTLMKFIYTCLSRESIGAMAAFWVYGQGLVMQRSKVGLFQSLLQQLLKACPRSLKQITSRFEDKRTMDGESWDWQARELEGFLVQTLKEACTTQARVIILVDALDELGEAVAVEIVDLFEDLIRNIPGHLKIIFACRHFPILTLDEGKQISLEHFNYPDIKKVVQEKLKRVTGSYTLVHEIVARSDGVFLWAILVVGDISKKDREGWSLESLRKHIRSLPKKLHELYADILDQPSNETVRLFEWIRFAKHPLSLQQLSHAIAVDAQLRFQWIDDYEREFEFGRARSQLERMVITLSRGLVEVGSRKSSIFLYENDTVHFIHQSVPDFLDRQNPANENISWLKLSPAKANIQLCRTCFAYMMLQDVKLFLDDPSNTSLPDLIRKLPLLKYAANTWSFHLKAAYDANAEPADILGCFSFEHQDEHSANDGRFTLSNDHGSVLKTCSEILSSLGDENRLQGTVVHVIAHLRLTRVVYFLIKVVGIDVDNARNQDGRTAAHIAAERGFTDILDVLLKAGAKIDLRDRKGKTPLILAIQGGFEDAVGTLVDAGADLHSEEDINQPLVVLAAQHQRIGAARILLCQGAAVDSRDSDQRTALHYAVAYENAELVKFLLSYKADMNLGDSCQRTPLFHAVADGNVELVKIILSYGPQVDIQDSNGKTPLQQSVESGKHSSKVITDLLLAAKPNVDIQDHKGCTPLSIAVHKSDVRLCAKLLAAGADVNVRDGKGKTPIFYTIQHAASKTLQRDRRIYFRRYSRTCFPRCSTWTCPFLMLLVSNADLTVRDNQGSTMFSPVAAVIKMGAIARRKKHYSRLARSDPFRGVNFEDPPLEPIIPLEEWNMMKEMILSTSEIRAATHGLTANLRFGGPAAEVGPTQQLHVPICGLIFRFNIHRSDIEGNQEEKM